VLARIACAFRFLYRVSVSVGMYDSLFPCCDEIYTLRSTVIPTWRGKGRTKRNKKERKKEKETGEKRLHDSLIHTFGGVLLHMMMMMEQEREVIMAEGRKWKMEKGIFKTWFAETR